VSEYRLRWSVEVERVVPPGVIVGYTFGPSRAAASGDSPAEALAALRSRMEDESVDWSKQLDALDEAEA
jgi:hypothetical protein